MNDATLLYRQIHPDFVQRIAQTGVERATSQAFLPASDGKISVYDGDQISAVASWTHYTQTLRVQSSGVMAVTPAECHRLGLPTIPDGVPFPEHASIDCREVASRRQIASHAKRLRAAANARSWQFRP